MEVTKHGPVTIVSFIQVNVMKQSPISRRTTHSPGIPTSFFPIQNFSNWGKTGIRVTAEINNIFNQQYEVVQCYPMPGTRF